MRIYCTICCKEKNNLKKPLESIKRYISSRISLVYNLSKEDNVEFRILSGKYGLLKPLDKIPWYDQKLGEKNIREIEELVKTQVLDQKIDEIIFFARNKNSHPDWKQWYKVIIAVCSELRIKLKIKEIPKIS